MRDSLKLSDALAEMLADCCTLVRLLIDLLVDSLELVEALLLKSVERLAEVLPLREFVALVESEREADVEVL